MGFAGDGGTADIGLQALSGMIDRNDKAIFICYDNEAYMNTGVQKSGLTPYGMKTTNTPSGKNFHGSQSSKKRMFEIVAAHGIPYAATASLGYPEDFMAKVEKAMNTDGTSYIHVMAPCPTGWGCPEADMVGVARDIVDCGLWYLAEYEGPQLSGVPGGSSSSAGTRESSPALRHICDVKADSARSPTTRLPRWKPAATQNGSRSAAIGRRNAEMRDDATARHDG